MVWFSVGGLGASLIRNTFKRAKTNVDFPPCLCHSACKKASILPTFLGTRWYSVLQRRSLRLREVRHFTRVIWLESVRVRGSLSVRSVFLLGAMVHNL